jgi:hypothetical protein
MSRLKDALKDAQDKNQAIAPLDLEILSTIIESELDNVAAGGGYCQFNNSHAKTAGVMAEDCY